MVENVTKVARCNSFNLTKDFQKIVIQISNKVLQPNRVLLA